MLKGQNGLSLTSLEFLKEHNQLHLIEQIHFLSPSDVTAINHQIDQLSKQRFSPLQSHNSLENCSSISCLLKDSTPPSTLGEKAIQEEQAVAVLLAGGDGTRLGFQGPKGCFPVYKRPLKTLFHLHCEKIKKMEKKFGVSLSCVILTSENNHIQTKQFFDKHHFFDLNPSKIFFIQQPQLPLLTLENKWFLNPSKKIATAPNGNGAILELLKNHFSFFPKARYFSIGNIDNPLPSLFDPFFLGQHINLDADVSLKVIKRSSDKERLGVIAQTAKGFKIIDYTQSEDLKNFLYCNINLFILSKPFLETFPFENLPIYQVKKTGWHYDPITNLSSSIPVLKQELFITDLLDYALKPSLYLSQRDHTFSPLKQTKGPYGLYCLRKRLKRVI